MTVTMARGRGLCRMCGERYAGLESVNIYEPRGVKPAYYVLLQELLGLNPARGDMKPDRLGLTCAKLLDDWAKFRDKCTEAQKTLAMRSMKLQQQQTSKEPEASGSGLSKSEGSTDGAGPSNQATPVVALESSTGSAAGASKPSLKRPNIPVSSDSEDSEEEGEEKSLAHCAKQRRGQQ